MGYNSSKDQDFYSVQLIQIFSCMIIFCAIARIRNQHDLTLIIFSYRNTSVELIRKGNDLGRRAHRFWLTIGQLTNQSGQDLFLLRFAKANTCTDAIIGAAQYDGWNAAAEAVRSKDLAIHDSRVHTIMKSDVSVEF